MVVVCFSDPLMRRMSSANLRLERLVESCSATLTPWLRLFHFCKMFMVDARLVLEPKNECPTNCTL